MTKNFKKGDKVRVKDSTGKVVQGIYIKKENYGVHAVKVRSSGGGKVWYLTHSRIVS